MIEVSDPNRCRLAVDMFLRGALEAVLFAMVCAAPWAFGSVEPQFESYLYFGVLVLLALWGARLIVQGRLSWKTCPVTLCLAVFFLYGVWQITPLPEPVLRTISPATQEMYDRLLPRSSERLPGEQDHVAIHPPAGSTISLNAGATRKTLLQLLAVFLVFAAVRNNLRGPNVVGRFSIILLVNGALMSLFGLLQAFTAVQRDMIYWRVPAEGTMVFGPFVNHNHFASYINVCIGLGLGLLTTRTMNANSRKQRHNVARGKGWVFDSAIESLHKPAGLWISAAVAIMFISIPLSLSRGGLLSLLAGGAIFLLVAMAKFHQVWKAGSITLSVLLALSLVSWLGWEQILTSRLATLWTGDAMGDVRIDLWSRCWNFVQAFPIWGTGFGTIQHVEPIYAHTPQQVGFIFAYAHNEYLEALVEGGIIRLLLTLLIIGFVFRLGVRALSQQSSFATHGLALGLLFSVTTLTVHSFVEFSIHIPAVALLATVVSALLCNLGDDAGDGETVRNPQGTTDRYVVRLAGLAPFAAAMVAVMLGGVLAFEGWKAARADQLEIAAYRLRQSVGLARLPQQLVYLDAAARLNPWDVRLRYALAQAQLDLYEEQSNNLPPADNDTRQRLKEEHLIHGLRQLLIARDMCPVMAEPHARIAAYVEELSLADPRLVYVDRAKFLAPADPLLWYLAGTLELGDNRPEQAWKSWRRALDLSSDYLQRIMNQSIGHLTPAEILKYVLPDRPEILLAAAEELFPTDRFTTQRQPFLEKCLSLLNESPVVLSTNELFMKARAHMLMDQPNEAIAAFRAGLLQAPEEYSRRYELAELLYQQGNTVDAHTQLKMIPSPQRKNAPTQKLLNQIRQDRAKGLGPSALTE